MTIDEKIERELKVIAAMCYLMALVMGSVVAAAWYWGLL